MSRLSEKIRKSREFRAKVGDWDLRLLRPVQFDAGSIFRDAKNDVEAEFELAATHTVGWYNVTEDRLLKGGKSDLIDFDADAWREVLKSDDKIWKEIVVQLLDRYAKFEERQEDEVKN